MEVSPVTDALAWDTAVAATGGHLLQSWAWGELKSRHGWSALRLADADLACGAQVLFRRLGPLSVAYVPRGPWGDLASDAVLSPVLAATHQGARGHNSIFLKLEPPLPDDDAAAATLRRHGFRPSAQRVQPVSTITVDLTDEMDAISARMKPKWRYNIGLASRKGVTVRQGGLDDLPAWYRLMEVTGLRDGFAVHSREYYHDFLWLLGPAARLLLAENQGTLLAGIVVAAFGGQAIYMYGASSDEGRNLMPNHLLQWEAMRWAKEMGCREYDLWGIPDEAGRAAASEESTEASPAAQGADLAGVYRFKSGFGGQVARTTGAWDYVYSAPLYWLYSTALPWYRRMRTG